MKKGYTLVELVVVIAISIIVLNISFLSIKGLNSLKSYGELQYASDSVIQFINGAKSFARSEEESVVVRLINNNTLGLYMHTKQMKVLTLPKEVIVSNITAKSGYIEVKKCYRRCMHYISFKQYRRYENNNHKGRYSLC